MTASPSQDMDHMGEWADKHAVRMPAPDPIPVGEVIELPEGIAQRMWKEALEKNG